MTKTPNTLAPFAPPSPLPIAIDAPPPSLARVSQIDLALSPLEAFTRWPTSTPLAAIWAEPAGQPWSRWTILAQPNATPQPITSRFEGSLWQTPTRETSAKHLQNSSESDQLTPPFTGGWIGLLAYELGYQIEPAAKSPSAPPHQSDPDSATSLMLRCDHGYSYDTWTNTWWRFGNPPDITHPTEQPDSQPPPFTLGPLHSEMGRSAYCQSVATIVNYIRAGDIFQANLTHQLSAPFSGSARAVFAALARSARPHHGAYVEVPAQGPNPARAIISMSPELFLDFDPATRRVITRPMKGTSSSALDPTLLARSEKDQAELNMIVDLMRNDLGRVCEFGSVKVEQARVIEQHGGATDATSTDAEDDAIKGNGVGATGVHQGVATITGTLSPGCTLADLLRATFAPGSVTGAPKIRAMQIIDELERSPRGPYCGAIGYVSDTGHTKLNVAIRTAVITQNNSAAPFPPVPATPHTFKDATLTYGIGAGIVADSIPEKEWDETITKAGILRAIAPSIEGG